MIILAIDTSCDETSAAVTKGQMVIANVVYSQVLVHQKWGGVVPSLAKRGHEERIDWVIDSTLKKAKITKKDLDYVAVTYGPGLAIALEVGINKAKEIASEFDKKLIAVNHMEGHLYSSFVQNSRGNPKRDWQFPYLGLLVSGGHTELVLFSSHVEYQILGETRDDAAGEALDKAARMLGFGYPGGPVIEKLAKEAQNVDQYHFPRPMVKINNLEFSFSGLKTSFLYYLQKLSDQEKIKNLRFLASSYQEAVFDTLVYKTNQAIKKTGVKRMLMGGGVAVNARLRQKVRALVRTSGGSIYFPPFSYLNFDNAAMIGVAAYYRAKIGLIVQSADEFDRVPRLSLLQSTKN